MNNERIKLRTGDDEAGKHAQMRQFAYFQEKMPLLDDYLFMKWA